MPGFLAHSRAASPFSHTGYAVTQTLRTPTRSRDEPLFGSVARGEAGPDSDYDLLLIVPDGAPPELRRSRRAYEALRGTGVAADVVVWTHSAFERRRVARASLPATVVREGLLLHGA